MIQFELIFYVCYAILALYTIGLKAKNVHILVWFLVTLGLLVTVHLKKPMWDMQSYEYYANLDQLQALYLLREIVYFKSLQILTQLFSFNGALIVFDILVIGLSCRTFMRLELPLIYWYTFFICFSAILGYQNIHRQFIASVILMWLISEAYVGYRNRKFVLRKALIFISPLIHNVAVFSVILAFPSILKKFKILIMLILLTAGFSLIKLLASTKSGISSGANFSIIFFIFLNVSYFLYQRKTIYHGGKDITLLTSMFLISSTLFFVALFTLPISGQERFGHLLIIIFFPYLMLGIRAFVVQKKVIDFLLHLLMHLPIYGTSAIKFLLS